MLKKLSAGAWVALVAAVLTLVSVIVYAVNIGSEGYFQGASVSNLVLWAVLALVLFVAVIATNLFELPGGVIIEVVKGICQIAAPALLTLCLINLVAARAEGLGFIYFSNADVALEVQTPANLSSATGTIANMVTFALAMLAGIVGAFFSARNKEAK